MLHEELAMRLNGTPRMWNPSRDTVRYRHFQVGGWPWLAAVFVVPMAFLAYAGLDDISRPLRYGGTLHFELVPWLVVGVTAPIAAWLAYHVWNRLTRDADGFLEIDAVARWLLAVDVRGIPGAPPDPAHPRVAARWYMVAFDDVASLTLVPTVEQVPYYSRGGRLRGYERRAVEQLVVLPDAAVVYRGPAGGAVRDVANRLAVMTGKPLVAPPAHGATPPVGALPR